MCPAHRFGVLGLRHRAGWILAPAHFTKRSALARSVDAALNVARSHATHGDCERLDVINMLQKFDPMIKKGHVHAIVLWQRGSAIHARVNPVLSKPGRQTSLAAAAARVLKSDKLNIDIVCFGSGQNGICRTWSRVCAASTRGSVRGVHVPISGKLACSEPLFAAIGSLLQPHRLRTADGKVRCSNIFNNSAGDADSGDEKSETCVNECKRNARSDTNEDALVVPETPPVKKRTK